MVSSRLKIFFKTYSLFLVLFISVAQCMFYPLNYMDYGIYAEAGNRIIHGFDPYSEGSVDGAFRSGYVAPLVLWLFTELSPVFLGVFVLRILSLFSLYKLVQSLAPELNRLQIQFLFSILLWTTPIRAMISNTQLTGILIGIYLLATWLCMRSSSRIATLVVQKSISSLLIVIGIDIRPQLFLPAIFIWVVCFSKYRFALLTLVLYLIFRFLIDFASPFNLNSSEINILQSLSSQDLSRSDTTSFWRVIQYFITNSNFANLYSIILWIVVMIIMTKKIRYNYSKGILIAGIGSLFLTFVHPYDYVFLAMIVIFENQKKKWNNILWLWILFLLIFPKSGSSFIINVIFGTILILIIIFGKRKEIYFNSINLHSQAFILAFPLSLLSSGIIARYVNEPIFHAALQLSIVTALVVIAYATEYGGGQLRFWRNKNSG